MAKSITTLVGRPALIGHLGEYIASRIFDIELEPTAVSKGVDGRFTKGKLSGKRGNSPAKASTLKGIGNTRAYWQFERMLCPASTW